MLRTLSVLGWLCCQVAQAQQPPAVPPAAVEAPKEASAAEASEKPSLLVTDLQAQGVDAAAAAALTDAIVQALSQRQLFRVLSSKDVQTVMSAERQRQLIGGCTGEDCAANLGEAMNAAFVLTGSLSKVGTAFQLALQTVDTRKGQPLGRSIRIASELSVLRDQVPYAASEATGAPLPPPRPRWLQYSMLSAGGAMVIAGGGLGMLALSRQSVLNDELCPGGVQTEGGVRACRGTNLQARSFYEAKDREIGGQKTLSLALMAAGAALAAGGLWLMPPPEGGPRVAMVPTANGLAVAGVWR